MSDLLRRDPGPVTHPRGYPANRSQADCRFIPSLADALPGQVAPACLGHPGPEVAVDLVADGLDTGQVVEQGLVVDLLPDRDAWRGSAGPLVRDDERAQLDAFVADEDAGARDEGADLVGRLGAERASAGHGRHHRPVRERLTGLP
jgi:hypothetical protein